MISNSWPSNFEVYLAHTPPLENESALEYVSRLTQGADLSIVSQYFNSNEMLNVLMAEIQKEHPKGFDDFLALARNRHD